MTPFDKRLEQRLTDALSDREQQIDVDPDAWQAHLDLTRALAGDRAGRPAAAHRWRAPALVAASVVGLGLIGGLLAQAALSGGSPVGPAGTGSSAVSTASGPGLASGPDRNIPTSTGVDAPAPADRRTTRPSPPASTGAAEPLPSDREPARTARSTRLLAPPSASTAALPPQARLTTQKAPATTGAGSSVWTTSDGAVPKSTSRRPDAGDATGGDTAPDPRTSLMIDVSSLMPCGAQLPDLEKVTSGISVESGPHGDIVTTTQQTAPLLAVGYAVLDGHGRIASTSGGDAAMRKTAGSALPSGRFARTDKPSILPTGLCAGDSRSTAGTAIDERIGEPDGSTVFQVGLQGALPVGTYSAVDVVLVGEDLAHATAYRTGSVWRFTNG